MYRVNTIEEMKVNPEDKEFLDITFLVSKVNELDPNQRPLEQDTHSITKHQKEIKDFLKSLIKIINNPLYITQLRITKSVQDLKQLINNFLSMKLGFWNWGAEHQKKQLSELKTMVQNAINILLELDAPAIWTEDDVVSFFEISMFNFYKQSTPQQILKQGWVLKKAGGRPNKLHTIQHIYPCLKSRVYSRKWFILTSQYMCYVETPFPKYYQKLKAPQNLMQNGNLQEILPENHHHSIPHPHLHRNNSTQYSGEEFILKEVMLIDSQWEMMSKSRMGRYKLSVLTNNRLLKLKFRQYYSWAEWKQKIARAMIKSPWNSSLERYVEKSFAPVRKGNRVKILIDGECYFRNLAEELRRAEHEIFITGWWVTNKYYLQRPICMENESQYEHNRFDSIILEAAKRGVKIYINMWKASRFAVAFDSQASKKYLKSLHPNIQVIRHPKNAISLWSHHAKLVLIDQQIVFIGGLDICFGRWDMRNHPLLDITDDTFQEQAFPGADYINDRIRAPQDCEEHRTCTLSRGHEVRMPWHDVAVCLEGESAMDYSHHFVELWNNAKLDKLGARNKSYIPTITTKAKIKGVIRKLQIKRGETPQKITGLNSAGVGIVAKDIKLKKIDEEEDSRFEEELQAIVQKNINLNYLKTMHKSPKMASNLNKTYFSTIHNIFNRFKKKNNKPMDPPQGEKMDLKADMVNQPPLQRAYTENLLEEEIETPNKKELPFEKNSHFFPESILHNNQDSQLKPSKTVAAMPQHIVEPADNPVLLAHNNQNDSLIEKQFDHIKNKVEYPKNFKDTKQTQNMEIDSHAYLKTEEIQILMHNLPHDHEYNKFGEKDQPGTPAKRTMSNLVIQPHAVDAIIYENCAVQALRSACAWSLGLLKVEHSIYEAYIQLIEKSKKFIFIQNQFFMTCNTANEEKVAPNIIRNKIGLALRERILRAHFTKEEFQVMVFIPLMPGFSGDVTDSISSILRIQIAYIQETISKGKTSLIELLKADGVPDPYKYIKFYSIRAHAFLEQSQTPVEEIIYIHAKLMIADDKYVILGSANINDRSMLGSRDHEIGIFISQHEPEDHLEVQFGSETMTVSKMAHAFRTELMMEHWSMSYEEVKDPLSNLDMLTNIAINNSRLFFEIFMCEPDNSIANFKELLRVREQREVLKRNKADYTNKYLQLRHQIRGHIVQYPTQFLIEENLNQNFLNSEIIIPEKTFV